MSKQAAVASSNIRARAFIVSDTSEPINLQFWEDYAKNERVTSLVVANRDFDEKKGNEHVAFRALIYFQNARSTVRTNKMLNPKDEPGARRLAIPCTQPAKQMYDYVISGEYSQFKHKSNHDLYVKVHLDLSGEPVDVASDLTALMQEIKDGKYKTMEEVAHANQYLWSFNRGALNEYFELCKPDRDFKTLVYSLWGNAGTGKSAEVYQKHYSQLKGNEADWCSLSGDPANPFIIGYTGKDIVVFDDFDPAQIKPAIWLKITDRYPFTVNVKGGSKKFTPKIIYFTSNAPPDTWWNGGNADGGWTEQVARRFTQVREIQNTMKEPDMTPNQVVVVKNGWKDVGITSVSKRTVKIVKAYVEPKGGYGGAKGSAFGEEIDVHTAEGVAAAKEAKKLTAEAKRYINCNDEEENSE